MSGFIGPNVDKPKVFLSVGSNGTKLQQEATDSIFAVIEASGLSPRQMERNEWSSEQPLRAIRRVIYECHGAVIIAFARYEFPSGFERAKNDSSIALGETRFPTVWNQIEAALAYGLDLPLLVICEHGLKDDGLLEGKYDWKVFWTNFNPEELRSERFFGFIQSWKRLVEEHVESSKKNLLSGETDIAKLSLSKLLSLLTVPQWWALLAAISSLLGTIAYTFFKLGAGKWPFQ
jgi:hypothetical protein